MSFLIVVAVFADFSFGGAVVGDPFAPEPDTGWRVTIIKGDGR